MIGRQDGFTLLEVLVAASLFGIVLLAVPSLLLSTTQADVHARDVTGAMNLAQDKLEKLRNEPYAALTSGADPSPINESGGTGTALAMFTRGWTVNAGPVAGTKELWVTVDWTHLGRQHVELRTIIAEQVK